jgi:putative phosphoesterase
MKITILADIHGNLPALDAVMRHANERNVVQTILNLGDMTGYGPFPDQVVKWSMSEQIINIIGNYDKKVISKSHRKRGWDKVKNDDKRAMFAWTYSALSKSSRTYLSTLPETRQVDIEGVRVLMSHGSPASINEHIGPDTPEKRLKALGEMADADLILCGHSHQPFKRRVKDVLFVNPGSVGRLDDGDPRASYSILEISCGKANVQFFRVPYNIMAAVKDLRSSGLPEIFTQVLRQGLNYKDASVKFKRYPHKIMLEPSGILTLLIGVGDQDQFADEMRQVIKKIAPQSAIVNISHQVNPEDVIQGASMLAEAVPDFPPGTVHVVAVDPIVDTYRSALAAQIGDHYFLAPNNGVLTFLVKKALTAGETVDIYHLNPSVYWPLHPNPSFHVRDIFAAVGAHLVNGLPLDKLGKKIDNSLLHKIKG